MSNVPAREPVITAQLLTAITQPILDTVVRKNTDYGSSLYQHGLKGIFIRMFDKIKRLERLVWEGHAALVVTEGVRDCFMDLIGYSVLAIAWIDENTPPPFPGRVTVEELDQAMKVLSKPPVGFPFEVDLSAKPVIVTPDSQV